MNEKFSCVFGDKCVLGNEKYQKMYGKLLQYWETWKLSGIKEKNIKGCLLELSKNNFSKLCTKIGSRDQALDALE